MSRRASARAYSKLLRKWRTEYKMGLKQWRSRPCRALGRLHKMREGLGRVTWGRYYGVYRKRAYWVRRSYFRKIKQQHRFLFRRCRARWRRLYPLRGKLNNTCRRKFRRGRKGRLYIGVKGKARLYINDTFCGFAPMRIFIRRTKYQIRLVSMDNSKEAKTTLRVYRTFTRVWVPSQWDPASGSNVGSWTGAKVATAPRTPTPRRAAPPARRDALNLPSLGTPRREPPPTLARRTPPPGNTNPPNKRVAMDPDIGSSNGVGQKVSPPLSDDRHQALLVNVGMQMFSRNFYYHDDIFGELPPYYLLLAPALAIELQWFPMAHFTKKGFLRHIGLHGHFAYAVGLGTRSPDGTDFPTTAMSYGIGLWGRIPVSTITFDLAVSFSGRMFENNPPPNTPSTAVVPGVHYQQLRFGGGVRWSVNRYFEIGAEGAYLLPFSTGQIATDGFFPKLTAGGFDVGARIRITPIKWLHIIIGAQLVHYFYSMNSEPGDQRVAGGAIDQYTNYDVRVGFSF